MKRPLVMRQALGDRIDLETRLCREDLTVKHVVVLHGTHSTAEVRQKVECARELLRGAPEYVDTVELALDELGARAVNSAARRRARFG